MLAQLGDLRADKKTVGVFILSTLCLAFIYYFGDLGFFLKALENLGLTSLKNRLHQQLDVEGDTRLRHLFFWICNLDFFYLIVPVLFIRFFLKAKLSDFGLNLKLEKGWWKIYLLFMCVMFPLVYFFSGTSAFQSKYPFYHIQPGTPLWPKFVVWELIYFSQFFCLEFFFRGFMVHGLKDKLGIYAVFVMTIPYCMIHFGKPFAETISAIIAGIVLGFLSYRNKSILLGFLLHITVAVSMDFLSLWRKGFF